MKRTFLLVLLVLLSATFASADYYIKQNVHTDAFSMMGQSQPPKDEVNKLWIGKNKMAMHGEEQSFVIDGEKNIAYMINHPSKSVVEMEIPLDISKYLPEQFMQMMGGVTVTVKPTGETQKIKEWTCSGYDVAMNMMMFKMNMKIWATKDVPFDWQTFQNQMFSQMAKATMRLTDEAVQEFLKIEGFQIKSEVTMNIMGADMKTIQEVVEIAKMDAPAGTYDSPVGYKKQDKLSMQDMMKR